MRKKIIAKGEPAEISYSDQTLFYYVHIKNYNSVDVAITEVQPTRENTAYKDAWVLSYSIDKQMTAISTIPVKNSGVEIDSIETLNTTETNVVSPAILASDQVDSNIEIKKIDIVPYNADKFKNDKGQYKFLFNTYNDVTKAKVMGNINIIDPDRLKLIRAVKANEVSVINNPHNQSNSLQFISEIFGYKKAQQNVNLSAEIEGDLAAFLSVHDDVLEVQFPLVRYDRGEVIVMYNVFFIKMPPL